jgi:lipopolysaccharide transport system permease protein
VTTQLSSTAAPRFRQLINPVYMARSLWRHRDLIGQMVRRDLGMRYRASYLGVLWSFITPLMMLAIYTFVFSTVFKARWRPDVETSTGEFALTLFAGMAAFNLFSEVTNRAPNLILQVPNYVKKVVFPLEVLPMVAAGTALVNSLITTLLVITGAALLLGQVSPTLWALPLAYLPLLLLSLGVAWLLASLGVYIRDIGQGVGLVVQMLFFMSPVFYPVTAVPAELRGLLLVNPLTFILTAFRQAILWGQPLAWEEWGLWTGLAALLALAGYAWFMRTKKGFADVM